MEFPPRQGMLVAHTAAMTSPRFVQMHREDSAALRHELAQGLLGQPASVSPKFLYDALGSRLFDAITELPEYYPTRTERAILDAHTPAIATLTGRGRTLIDLGAGNCAKAARLFDVLAPMRYVAVDISVDYLRAALTSLQRQHPGIEMVGVGADFSAALTLPDAAGRGERLVFYPGSSIGNFTPEEASHFLGDIHAKFAGRPGSGLLIGVDGKKEKRVLDAAYDDSLGVTAAFNRNALLHLNARFGFDFPLDGFVHRGFYNEALGRIEMHLEALRDLKVHLGYGSTRKFAEDERIHTENSYKYGPAQFEALLRGSGFTAIRYWPSPHYGFFVFYAS
jgi:L-histidine Nalpha-methyltransferase